jgi:hypothetical protein
MKRLLRLAVDLAALPPLLALALLLAAHEWLYGEEDERARAGYDDWP